MTTVIANAARSRLRTVVHGCVFVGLAAGLIETWLIGGLVIPCRVVGGSMAGALLGGHRDVVCSDCGYPFACGTDVPPAAARAVCPNCGYAVNPLQPLLDLRGDRVLIDRTAFSIRAPRRWEIVAFQGPCRADKILVKRVVGLPGESIKIAHGDVYVDGKILRKDLAEQRALAVLVHDADFPPTPRRWRAERPESRWSAAGRHFTHVAGDDRAPVDWLVYHHWRRLPAGDRVEESPITDVCGYNQSQPRREEDIHAVPDVRLSFRLGHLVGGGAVWVRVADGRDRFETRLQRDAGRTGCQVFRNGQLIPAAVGKMPVSDAERLVEASLEDQQFLLAVDGRPIVTWPYDRPQPPRSPVSAPVAIGAEGIGVTVDQMRVYRDVYYTDPLGREPNGPLVRLAVGEYYVLGDNSPVSEDSRNWVAGGEWRVAGAAVDAKSLVGKPLVAIPSVPFALWGRSYFQVPNPGGIRYIR